MSKLTCKTGTGMTERTIVGFDPTKPADLTVLLAAAKETLGRTSFQHLSGKLMDDAGRILARAGLPADASSVYELSDYGDWRMGKGIFGPDTELGEDSLPLSVLIQSLGFAHDTPEGYAANVLMLLDQANRQLSAGSLDEAMATAFDLGALVTEASMKDIFEVDFLTGEKVHAGGRKGHALAHGSSADREADWAAYADAFEEELAKSGLRMKAYKAVAKRFDVAVVTVRRAVRWSNDQHSD